MAYYFYLNEVLLPVTPEKLECKIKNRNQTIELINGQEINIPKSAGLTEYRFDALLPNQMYPFSVYGKALPFPPKYYLDTLEALKKKGAFLFRIMRNLPTGTPVFDTSTKVLLEEYTIKESAEYGFDVMVSIQLKQYADYATEVKTLEVKENKNGVATAEQKQTDRPSSKESPKTYTVVSGDNLWSICKKQLGDGSKCYEIAKLNNLPDPNRIQIGQVIRFE